MKKRNNPFCVISIASDENGRHYIQTNSGWNDNPYEDYVVVPDDLVIEICETQGYCDIVLNEEGTEVVSFTARDMPEIPEAETPASKIDQLIEALYKAGKLTEEEYQEISGG